jgi:tRNA A-37 threonylcarbamoyl transferase component Bud32
MSLQIRFFSSEVESNDLRDFCNDPDCIMETGRLIKNDKTTTLSRLNLDIGEVVVKRYNTKNKWHWLRRSFQTSRARNCMTMSQHFSDCGIQVCQPIAMIESRVGFFRGKSWFVSKFGENELLVDFLSRDQKPIVIERVKRQIASMFQKLVDCRLSHGDMKATNILVKDDDLILIDLDASRKHYISLFHKIAISKDKNRFLKNWKNSPELLAHFSEALLFLDDEAVS